MDHGRGPAGHDLSDSAPADVSVGEADDVVDRGPRRARPTVGTPPQEWARRAGTAAVLLVSFGFLLVVVRQHWFFYDEWAYLDRDVEAPGDSFTGWLFTPHNEHTVVWTKLWFQGVFALVGLHWYWLYALPLVLSILGAAYAAYLLVRRLGGSWLLAVISIVPFVFMGSGGENLVWAGQFAFVLPVTIFLGWLALELSGRLIRPRWARPVLAVAVSVIGALSSLVWLPFALVAAAAMVVRRRFVEAAALAVPPVVALVVSRRAFPSPTGTQYAASGLGDYLSLAPSYVWYGLSHAFQPVLGSAAASAVLVLLLIPGLLLFGKDVARLTVGAALLLGPVLFLMVTGYGRIKLGPEQSTSGRYTWAVLACLIPLAVAELAVLTRIPARWAGRLPAWFQPGTVVAAAGVVVVAVVSVNQLRDYLTITIARDEGSRAVIDAAATRLSRDPVRVDDMGGPEPTWAPQLTATTLWGWVRDGDFVPRRPKPLATAQADVNLEWPARTTAAVPPADPLAAGCKAVVGPKRVRLDASSTVLRRSPGQLYLRPADAEPATPEQASVQVIRAPGNLRVTRLASDVPAVVLQLAANVRVEVCP